MTATVEYHGELRTTCTHIKSGNSFETDAPTDNHGKGERFSPTDLMATSLATCMLTVMGIKARSIGFDLTGIRVDVLKKMRNDPRRISGIDLRFHIPEELTNLEPDQIEVLKNIGINCPVQLSIHPDIQVDVEWGEWA